MKKIAVFPGSFDPFTTGHKDIVLRGINIFDEVIIAVGINSRKKNLFSLEQRIGWIEDIFSGFPNIKVKSFDGLTVDFCKENQAEFIIRGLRSSMDFEYEKPIAQLNNLIGHGIETVVVISKPEYMHISSSIVREIIKYGGDVSQFVPKEIVFNK